jgi:hypothetical protein
MSRRKQHHSTRPSKVGGVSTAEFMLRMVTRHPRPLHPEAPDCDQCSNGGDA